MSTNQFILKQFINNPLYTSLYNKYKNNPPSIPDVEFMSTIEILKSKGKGMEMINCLCFNHGHIDAFNFLSYDTILRNIVTDYIKNYL